MPIKCVTEFSTKKNLEASFIAILGPSLVNRLDTKGPFIWRKIYRLDEVTRLNDISASCIYMETGCFVSFRHSVYMPR